MKINAFSRDIPSRSFSVFDLRGFLPLDNYISAIGLSAKKNRSKAYPCYALIMWIGE